MNENNFHAVGKNPKKKIFLSCVVWHLNSKHEERKNRIENEMKALVIAFSSSSIVRFMFFYTFYLNNIKYRLMQQQQNDSPI